MHCFYYLNGKLLTQVVDDDAPAEGTEVCIDDQYYRVKKAIRYINPCPPWFTNIHLEVSKDQAPDPAYLV